MRGTSVFLLSALLFPAFAEPHFLLPIGNVTKKTLCSTDIR
jgi:hypothetical protein